MPVSGHEETGVKSFAGQFSDLTAGVPIKKRRLPFFRPYSPPAEEPPSLSEETELQRKENSSTSQGSTLSNASVAGAPIKKRKIFPLHQFSSSPLNDGPPLEESDVLRKEQSNTSQGSTISTSSSGLSDANGNPLFEEKKASTHATDANMVQSNSCLLRPKLEEPNLSTQSCTLDVKDNKEKMILDEDYDRKMGPQLIRGNPELSLAPKHSLALNIGADVSKQSVQEICKRESAVVPESTPLPLSLKKDHLFPAVARPEIQESQKIKKTEPVSLELSLSKEESTTQSSNSDAKPDSDAAAVHSNRANWDLNTTMDAWEESDVDAGSVKASIEGMKTIGNGLDENHFKCSTGMTPLALTAVVAAKQTIKKSQSESSIALSGLHCQHYKRIDPRNLSLGLKYAEDPSSRLSVPVNSANVIPTANLPTVVASAGDVSSSSLRLVKSEPFDENLKRDLKEANNTCHVGSLDNVAVKKEFVQQSSVKSCNSSTVESSKSSTVSNLKLVYPMPFKSEPGHVVNPERPKTTESKTDQLCKELPQESDNYSSAMAVPGALESPQVSVETARPPVKPVCSAELTTNENIVSQLEHCTQTAGANVEKVSPGACSSAEQIPLETVPRPIVDNATEQLSELGMKDSSIITKEENAEDRDDCRLKLMNEPPPDMRVSREGCVSDEEKITLSADMLEDDSCSDYESDGNHAVTAAVDTVKYAEDDDYEDGEVREPLEHSTAEDTVREVREVENSDSINYESKQMEKGVVIGDSLTSSFAMENDNKTVMHGDINRGEDGVDIEMHERAGKVIDKIVCLQESVDGEKPDVASDGKQPVNLFLGKPLDLSEGKDVSISMETELSPHQGTNAGVDALQYADEVVKTTETVRQNEMEVSTNTDDANKDVSSGGNQGRIIDLSRAASSSSPSKTRPISGKSLPSRPGRDLLSDTLDGDKIQRGREEVYIDAPRKFSRERHHDISPRNSRMNFVRGRGRGGNNRMDTLRGEWESDREFSGEFYNGPNQYRGPRPKYASTMANSDMEYNNVAPDGSYVGHGRMGRKPLNDGSYIAPRRRSPGGGRDGIQMGHRIPRSISPSRCIGGDGSEMVGMRHGEKFMRSFPDDNLDSIFPRPQPFEGMDGRFTRGNRNFSSMQRRGPPRIRSKSPIRSRSRSPGPWTSPRRRSPRRRSPDGFGGHPDLGHRRSPLYRVDRMRSPDRHVFPGERVVRRHGSPSYMSRPNDIRDMDSARDHGHPRPVMSNRSPSGRILIRNRRFDVVDPRDRSDNDDDYFGGPMHSGRMLELNNEGNGEERRRFGERRGPVHSFRPPYNGNVNENFHLNAEDGPRHYRFCSDDSEFHERGNMRERDFDRRIKGRPGNNGPPPRRTRNNMDEQEENFRHGGGGGGQVWSDDSFDDISRVKRKRF